MSRPVTLCLRASLLFGALTPALLPSIAAAEVELPQASPAASVSQRVGLTDIQISYSSPGMKGRTLWGGLVPYKKVWRTGANGATVLETSQDIQLGGKTVPAGKYSVFTIPGESEWTFILNKDTNLWGADAYKKADDVVRVKVKPKANAEAVERMTFTFANTTDEATELVMSWGKVQVPVAIKALTGKQMDVAIKGAVDNGWRDRFNAGRYLYESRKDMKGALEHLNASIMSKPTWRNTWYKAQVLHDTGKHGEARKQLQQAMTLGKGDRIYEDYYKPQLAKALADWPQS